MRVRGAVSLLLVAAVVAGGVAAGRFGPATPAAAQSGPAESWAWLCPHGGGAGWEGVVALANPGDSPVRARVTTLTAAATRTVGLVTVPAGGEVLQRVPAGRRESSSFVEVFGGWLAVGWMVRADDPDTGLSAEPCAPQAGVTWLTTESSSEEGEQAYLVIANPFAADAVFDVTLFSPDRPPLRDLDWTDLTLKGGRSMALPLSKKIVGEEAVAAVLQAKVGRVAVATLGITDGGGVRGVLGAREPATVWHLPTGEGAGQATLVTFVPGDKGLRFGASLFSREGPQAAGGLVDAQQQGASTQVSPVITSGPSSIVVTALGDQALVAAQRAEGQSADDAATGGTAMPATEWVVLPTVAEEPSVPGLVVENPGAEAVSVTLRLLTPEGVGPREASFELAASGTAGAPRSFFEGASQAAVLVTATGPITAAGASTSSGVHGLSLYALSMGVPVPDGGSAGLPESDTAVP